MAAQMQDGEPSFDKFTTRKNRVRVYTVRTPKAFFEAIDQWASVRHNEFDLPDSKLEEYMTNLSIGIRPVQGASSKPYFRYSPGIQFRICITALQSPSRHVAWVVDDATEHNMAFPSFQWMLSLRPPFYFKNCFQTASKSNHISGILRTLASKDYGYQTYKEIKDLVGARAAGMELYRHDELVLGEGEAFRKLYVSSAEQLTSRLEFTQSLEWLGSESQKKDQKLFAWASLCAPQPMEIPVTSSYDLIMEVVLGSRKAFSEHVSQPPESYSPAAILSRQFALFLDGKYLHASAVSSQPSTSELMIERNLLAVQVVQSMMFKKDLQLLDTYSATWENLANNGNPTYDYRSAETKIWMIFGDKFGQRSVAVIHGIHTPTHDGAEPPELQPQPFVKSEFWPSNLELPLPAPAPKKA